MLYEVITGKAWAQRHPVVLCDLQNSYFVRREAAANAGLTCGVALPIFAGDVLVAVVVLFCGDDEKHVGAIELWHNDPETSLEMSLVDGYFGDAEGFEWISRHTSFRPGFRITSYNVCYTKLLREHCNLLGFDRKIVGQ